jgi:hypothetical protein
MYGVTVEYAMRWLLRCWLVVSAICWIVPGAILQRSMFRWWFIASLVYWGIPSLIYLWMRLNTPYPAK